MIGPPQIKGLEKAVHRYFVRHPMILLTGNISVEWGVVHSEKIGLGMRTIVEILAEFEVGYHPLSPSRRSGHHPPLPHLHWNDYTLLPIFQQPGETKLCTCVWYLHVVVYVGEL